MSEKSNIRKERVERLLRELEYEVTRGMLEGDLEEEMGFRFYVPISKKIHDGVVGCEFRTRPMPLRIPYPSNAASPYEHRRHATQASGGQVKCSPATPSKPLLSSLAYSARLFMPR